MVESSVKKQIARKELKTAHFGPIYIQRREINMKNTRKAQYMHELSYHISGCQKCMSRKTIFTGLWTDVQYVHSSSFILKMLPVCTISTFAKNLNLAKWELTAVTLLKSGCTTITPTVATWCEG